MDIDFSIEVKHHWAHERPYKVTLTRGAGGQYRWEIEVREVAPEAACVAARVMDLEMANMYGGLEPPDQD